MNTVDHTCPQLIVATCRLNPFSLGTRAFVKTWRRRGTFRWRGADTAGHRGLRDNRDVPFEGFKVDDVLVGLPGFFAMETKTRRKPVDVAGTKEYRVEF